MAWVFFFVPQQVAPVPLGHGLVGPEQHAGGGVFRQLVEQGDGFRLSASAFCDSCRSL